MRRVVLPVLPQTAEELVEAIRGPEVLDQTSIDNVRNLMGTDD